MDETALTSEPGSEPQPELETQGEGSKGRKRSIKKALIPGLVVAGLVAGVATWALIPKQDDLYFKALTDGGFADSFATQEIAVIQAEAICAGLAGGEEPTGFDYQKVGVDFYCPDFSEIYKVVPTPEQQQEILVTSLREADLGGLYPSEAAAVAAAQAVCTDLRNGGESQGVEAGFIGVEIYCSEFASGFRVLKEIKVVGKFVIDDDSYWLDLIYSRNGECSGGGAYDDVYEGTRVVVRNGDGEKLTETALMQGKGNNSRCTFRIEFTVLEGEDTYEVEVGRRGTLSYSEAELKIPNKVAGYLG